LRGLGDDRVERLLVVQLTRVDRRRDALRLDQCLILELGRGPSLQVDRERDAERDDEDQEDVREREDEAGADLRGCLLSLIGR
jgi:hypothetical protein